jgi:hypothetical protein
MDRVPEKENVRIGFRIRDFLEAVSCRTCGQKFTVALVPFMASFVYFREYQLKYGHYPILRASYQLTRVGIRQQVHYLLPLVAFSVGFWWMELAYNRCVLGIQGAEPMPDEILKRDSYP